MSQHPGEATGPATRCPGPKEARSQVAHAAERKTNDAEPGKTPASLKCPQIPPPFLLWWFSTEIWVGRQGPWILRKPRTFSTRESLLLLKAPAPARRPALCPGKGRRPGLEARAPASGSDRRLRTRTRPSCSCDNNSRGEQRRPRGRLGPQIPGTQIGPALEGSHFPGARYNNAAGFLCFH